MGGLPRIGGHRYSTINREGRIPALAIPGLGSRARLLTQAAAILEYLEDLEDEASLGKPSLMPSCGWARARVRQVCWLIGADVHPMQNMGMLTTGVAKFGLLPVQLLHV
jgi:maleylacetoacetate isomerase